MELDDDFVEVKIWIGDRSEQHVSTNFHEQLYVIATKVVNLVKIGEVKQPIRESSDLQVVI